MFDVVIVGAGFAGSVLARKIAEERNGRVLLIEKRNHIGGNCYDARNADGILVHKYGPHLFHTSNEEVFSFLSRFTTWREYQHHVHAVVDGKEVPIPFNLNTLERLFPTTMAASLEKKLVDSFGFGKKIPILELRKTDDQELELLADYIYQNVFAGYTAKQWGCKPEEISDEVTGRVPVYVSRDDRYFQDTYQVVPEDGYTALFEKLLEHENIHILSNTDYKQVVDINIPDKSICVFGKKFIGQLIFTGMIDEFFEFSKGRLPYRTTDFSFQRIQKKYYQNVTTVNYPNNYNFTRITEFKHIHPQLTDNTIILREFPRNYLGAEQEKDTPSYPVFNSNNQSLFATYQAMAKSFSQVIMVGRLAEYRYYDMDDIVARSLEVFKNNFSRDAV